MIVDGVNAFWSHVERREPPPFDYDHPTALSLLRKLYPGTNGETITLDAAALHWHAVRMQADERAKHYEAVSNGARAHLLDMVGDVIVVSIQPIVKSHKAVFGMIDRV